MTRTFAEQRPQDAIALFACLGLAALLTLDWSGELVSGLASAETTPAGSAVSGCASVLAFAACAFGHHAFERCLATRRGEVLVAVAGIAACMGRALSALAPTSSLLFALGTGGLVLRSLAEPALLVTALALISWHAAPRAPVIFPAAYLTAALAHFVMRAMPAGAVTIACALLPLACALSLAGALGSARLLEPDIAPVSAPADSPRWSFPVRPVALMVVYNLAFYFSLAFSAGPNPYGPLGMLAVSLAALACTLLRPQDRAPVYLYRLALPLMVANLTFLAFLGEGRTFAVAFGNSGNVAFMLFMLVTLAGLCHRYVVSPAWMCGLTYAFAKVASVAGLPAGQLFTQAFPAGSEESRLAMCLVIVSVVTLSTVFFNDEVAARSFGMVPAPQGEPGNEKPGRRTDAMSYAERIVWKCSQVGRRFGLTQREQEILELMAQGISTADIADRTCISYGTVKTHVGHVYRKLGVHSREEAVALVHKTDER